MVWNGYDGNIYITTARRLPEWQPPKLLMVADKGTKFHSPTIISELGDRLSEKKFRLYLKRRPKNPKPNSSFMKIDVELRLNNKPQGITKSLD